jgi:hypothetical protein
MKRFLFVLAAAALFAPAALAKGPSQATISGPGLGKAVSVNGTEGSGALGNLTQYAGFFPAAFSQSPDPMLPAKPTGKLGPRYTIRYVVPAGGSVRFRLTQDLYPYAKGGAVTYMKPGQRIFDSRTKGGWYPGGTALKDTLVRAGLPKSAPRGSSSTNLGLVAGIGIPGAMALAGAAFLVARRRSRS